MSIIRFRIFVCVDLCAITQCNRSLCVRRCSPMKLWLRQLSVEYTPWICLMICQKKCRWFRTRHSVIWSNSFGKHEPDEMQIWFLYAPINSIEYQICIHILWLHERARAEREIRKLDKKKKETNDFSINVTIIYLYRGLVCGKGEMITFLF